MNDKNEGPPELLYRFRPLIVKRSTKDEAEKTVVQELRNQEIYFSALNELNDPMDGYQSACFEGDTVLWTNFVKFYLLNLSINMFSLNVADVSKRKNISTEVLVFQTKSGLSNKMLDQHEIEFKEAIGNPLIKMYLEILIKKRKLHMSQLLAILVLLHPVLQNICKRYLGPESFPDMQEDVERKIRYAKKLLDDLNKGDEKEFNSMVALSPVMDDLYLSFCYEHKQAIADEKTYKVYIIDFIANYPKSFLPQFVKSIYPDFAVACFSGNDRNSSMWGHYAEGHRGICLMFKPKSQTLFMSDKQKRQFYSVNYGLIPSEINVFENLGTFPQKDVDENWLTFDGKASEYNKLYSGDDNYVKSYWGNFNRKVSFKFQDWGYECEHRLITNRLFYGDKVQKLLKYDFSMLSGIVFGINTPIETKIALIEVIEDKCREYKRNDFVLKQAEYSQLTNEMQIRMIDGFDLCKVQN